MLRDLKAAGIGCPEVIAAGEDDRGQAFLLVRELDALDLRVVLRDRLIVREERLRLRGQLGETLAHIHAAGFDYRDLYSKHVLVGTDEPNIHFLDWQRSCRRQVVSGRAHWRTLAALDATVADDLATPRERLACLRSYLGKRIGRPSLRHAVGVIQRLRERLLRRRHIREQRQPPPTVAQNLIWLDGEALCVTRAFQAVLKGQVPRWLSAPNSFRSGLGPLTRRGGVVRGSAPGLAGPAAGQSPTALVLDLAALAFVDVARAETGGPAVPPAAARARHAGSCWRSASATRGRGEPSRSC